MLRKATSKIAHNPTVTTLRGTNQDLRVLQNLIAAEKTVLITLQKLSVDFAKASEALKAWALTEVEDIGGILNASTLLLNHFSSALSQYASHGHSIRRQLKAIRTRVESLDDLKRQRRTLYQRAEESERHLSGMDPDHRNFSSRTETLNGLREDVRDMNSTIKVEEAALADFKRTSTKMWMGLKFGGLVECCEKGAIAGRFGKLVIAEISEEISQPGLPRSLNYRRDEVESCVANAHRGVNAVALSTVPFVGFRDRDQYVIQRPQAATPPSRADTPVSDPTPATFYISSEMGYTEAPSNEPSSLPGEPPSFPQPQPQCSCEPQASSGDQPPQESRSSLLSYPQENTEPSESLPQTFTFPQPEVNDGTFMYQQPQVNDGIIDISPAAAGSEAGLNIARGITPAPSVMIASDPVTGAIFSDTASIAGYSIHPASIHPGMPMHHASMYSQAHPASIHPAPVQVAVPQVYVRTPGTFGGNSRDPYSMRARFSTPVEEPVVEVPPSPKEGSSWTKFLKFLKK